jgi:hypothetical protein
MYITYVPVYRIVSSVGGKHLTDTTTPPIGAVFYSGYNATWFGCGETGTNRTPIYQWENTTTQDFVFSASNVSPFTNGTNGYSLTSPNPVLWLFSVQYFNTIPIYVMEGFQLTTAITSHVAWQNSTLYPNQQFLDNSVIYEQNVNSSDIGILGYGFIQ